MSHVTEGELHTYIDGALASLDAPAAERIASHLETCGDCEARAEAARALRDRASSLLNTALGDVIEAPPFEELVERAGVDVGVFGSRSGRQPLRLQRFAWAASLLVALGAGWMANAILRDSGDAPLLSVAEPEAVAPMDEDAATEFEQNRQELPNARATVGASEDRPSGPDSQNERSVGQVSGEARDARENVPRDVVRGGANLEAADALGADSKPARSDVAASAQRREAGVEERLAEAPATPEVRNRALGFADAEPAARERTEQGEAQETESALVADQLAKASADMPEEFGLESSVLDSLAWRPVEVVEAAAWVGGILTLPDVEVEEYALSAHEGRRLARVRQRLPGGETLEIVQFGADPALDELREVPRRELDRAALGRAPAETGSRVGAFTLGWIEVAGAHVRASAPVAPDSLRALISRIRRP